jgi:dihydropteroate synthase
VLMGILNVTPDSFSDGGQHTSVASAVQHAERMVAEGAALIDVGGESTRPGAAAVTAAAQMARVLPVLHALREALPSQIVLSVDTRSPQVATESIAAGATVINDISGGATAGMLELAAAHGVTVVLMHMQGTPENMQAAPGYQDVVGEVLAYLLQRAAAAEQAGVAQSQILLDPGIGFGKTRAHNLALLRALPQFVASGYPILLGTSRKRFMGAICRETEFSELLGATCATTALGVAAGVKVFRVHDVKANRQALEVAWAIGESA